MAYGVTRLNAEMRVHISNRKALTLEQSVARLSPQELAEYHERAARVGTKVMQLYDRQPHALGSQFNGTTIKHYRAAVHAGFGHAPDGRVSVAVLPIEEQEKSSDKVPPRTTARRLAVYECPVNAFDVYPNDPLASRLIGEIVLAPQVVEQNPTKAALLDMRFLDERLHPAVEQALNTHTA